MTFVSLERLEDIFVKDLSDLRAELNKNLEEVMYLVGWDTDQIKSYVFATPKLKEIRGASALLDELSDQTLRALVTPEELVFAGGGSGMAELETLAEAENLMQLIPQIYRQQTHSAEITCAILKSTNDSFGQNAQRLNFILRTRKDEKVRKIGGISSSIIKSCDSCGQYPASQRDHEEFICRSCQRKRDISLEVRNGNAHNSRLWQLLDYDRGQHSRWTALNIFQNAPEDFTEIGETSTPKGYLGFIYCDGNRMGALLAQLQTKQSFTKFSEGIRNILQQSLFDVLLEEFNGLQPEKKFPFEIIFLGGDDLVLVTAADHALSIAHKLCQEFERRSESLLIEAGIAERTRLSMCAAVVLAQDSLPIYHMQSIADDLLKSAKQQSLQRFEDTGEEVSFVDFHVVSASASDLPTLMRKADWRRESYGVERLLTERPYAANDLAQLLTKIHKLKQSGFPSSKLQMLYESIVDGSMTQAMFNWAFVAGRARRGLDPVKNQLLHLLTFFEQDANIGLYPWRQRSPKKHTTPMVDVTELYDFVK